MRSRLTTDGWRSSLSVQEKGPARSLGATIYQSLHLSVEWLREAESPKYRGNIRAQIMNRVQSWAFQVDHSYSAVDQSNCCDGN